MKHWLDRFFARTYPRDGQGTVVRVTRDPFAWLIETTTPSGTIVYWTGRGTVDFSPDPERAIRFSRKIDAEIVRDWTLRNSLLRVVEHGWCL